MSLVYVFIRIYTKYTQIKIPKQGELIWKKKTQTFPNTHTHKLLKRIFIGNSEKTVYKMKGSKHTQKRKLIKHI